MILKSVRLRNIRSYIDEKIDFKEGSTLLSGDIGSGKSTILMAIDFSLFGLKRGELQGTELLRHGSNEGLVELDMASGNAEIKIRRTLKKGKGIAQDAGSISIDGCEYAMSPAELKAKIMEILGYSQPGIFRYTVYTPQEEMKSILFNPEARLNVLRSVFETDKYSRIKSNSKLLISEIRASRKEQDALAAGIDEKMRVLSSSKEILSSSESELRSVHESAAVLKKKYEAAEVNANSIKSEYQEAAKALSELHRSEAELKSLKSRHSRIIDDMAEIESRIRESSALLEGGHSDPSLLKKMAADADAKRERLLARRSSLEKEIENHSSILEKKFCIVCGQAVNSPEDFRAKISSMKKEAESVKAELEKCSMEAEEIRDEMIKSAKIESARKNRENDARWLEKLEGEKNAAEALMPELEGVAAAARLRAEEMSGLEARMKATEKEMRNIQEEKIKVEKAMSRLEQQISDVSRLISGIEAEIIEKREARLKSARLSEIEAWMESYFIPLVGVIEKNVLASIQMEFDRFFQSWFGLLMGDQLSVRIDDEFTPVIEQNGYETEYANLSGGEKTSVALAYRLALNKTINMLSDGIKTKDIIILDEPTDGFSTEQLDRIRDVISQLNIRQIIIVSHEPKIDSFVDSVIKVYKENHVSKVAY